MLVWMRTRCTLKRAVRKVIGTTGVCDGHFKPLEVKARLCFQSGAAIAIPSGSVCSVNANKCYEFVFGLSRST